MNLIRSITLIKPTSLFSFSSLRSNSTYALKNKNMNYSLEVVKGSFL